MRSLLWTVGPLLLLFPVAGHSQVGSDYRASTPSQAGDVRPVLDYTRRVLTCDSLGCVLNVVRSQQELMEAISVSERQKVGVVPMWQSTDGGKTWIRVNMTVPVYRQTKHLILGGCFGADLPLGENLRIHATRASKPTRPNL
jgi:hypothetical protein